MLVKIYIVNRDVPFFSTGSDGIPDKRRVMWTSTFDAFSILEATLDQAKAKEHAALLTREGVRAIQRLDQYHLSDEDEKYILSCTSLSKTDIQRPYPLSQLSDEEIDKIVDEVSQLKFGFVETLSIDASMHQLIANTAC